MIKELGMKFATFRSTSGVTWGVELDGTLFDLGPSGLEIAESLKDAIVAGALPRDRGAIVSAPSTPAEAVEFLPPIPDPSKIICVGVNYRSHQEETGKAAPAAPTIFTRFADSQMGHEQPAVYPISSTQFDYEGEMAVIIGVPAFHVSEEDAHSVIAGYSVYNDFSVRDWQRASSQWIPGKNFPGTGGFGPYFIPSSEIPDVGVLKIETRVNGEVRQSASLADLVFTIPELIAYITGFTPLAPGDVIVTGTPGGVGLFMQPQALLREGDLVEVEIKGLGILRNSVRRG